MTIDASDELDHFAGPSSAWSETWEFRAAAPDLDLGVAVAVVRRPAEGQMSYRAAVLGRSRPVVVIVEHELVAPRIGLEIRGSGLWADHVCESPHEHWSFTLESFALAIDQPTDLVDKGRGLPVPLGFDLGWETDRAPVGCATPHDHGYLAAGTVHGEVLIADETLPLDGHGVRIHRWGVGPALPEWWSLADTVGVGEPPWAHAFEEATRVSVHDPVGQIAELALGAAVEGGGVTGPAWRSIVVDE